MHIKNKKTMFINKRPDQVLEFLREHETSLGKLAQAHDNLFLVPCANNKWTLSIEKDITGKALLVSNCDCEGKENFLSKYFTFSDEKSLDLCINIHLRKLKALIENGEIPTIEGQPHGERSLIGEAIESLKDHKRVKGEDIANLKINMKMLAGNKKGYYL